MTHESRRDWSIQEIARLAKTTSRTLRHYGDLGLLEPTRVGGNGYRYYDQDALVRLQRILLLRDLGLGLPAISDVLENEEDAPRALHTHLSWLRAERERLARQIASVEKTITTLKGGEQLMAENMFDGFDHTQYKEEVEERWGKDAYEKGDRWWRSLADAEKKAFQQQHADIAQDYGRAHANGLPVDGEEVQAIAKRHLDWLGASGQGPAITAGYFVGLGEMYVADPRFGAGYDKHGSGTAEYVRDAMTAYAEKSL